MITGPVHVEGARPGDVLKIEPLSALPRVPYGVISSRHGKGALSASFATAAGGITSAEVMPATPDGRADEGPAAVRQRLGVHPGPRRLAGARARTCRWAQAERCPGRWTPSPG